MLSELVFAATASDLRMMLMPTGSLAHSANLDPGHMNFRDAYLKVPLQSARLFEVF